MIWLLACTGDTAPKDTGDPVCPAYSGMNEERVLHFEVHDEADVSGGSWTRTIERDGANPRVTDEGVLIADDEVVYRTIDEYLCDAEGVWWLAHDEDIDASSSTAHQRTEWTTPPRILGWDLEVGQRWEGEVEFIRTADEHADPPRTDDYVVEVVASYVLTTPAGAFDVLDVRFDDRPSFRTEDLGEVRDGRGELVSIEESR